MNDFNEQFDTILPQALGRFVAEQLQLHEERPEEFDVSPLIFFQIENSDELFEFIMNHDYWVRRWSNYLFNTLVHEIYHTGDFQFSLN